MPAGVQHVTQSRSPWRRWWPWLLTVLIAAAIVVVVIAVRFTDSEPSPTPTVTAAAPTPSIEASERATDEALADALADEVLAYAVVDQEELEPSQDSLGGFRLTYSDGEQEAVIEARQWRDTEAAEAAWQQQSEELAQQVEREGDVEVDGEEVGEVVITEQEALWRNGSVVLWLEAPGDAAAGLYDAYPL